eukprot:5373625-Alexandrium_andersonii.AAC.1
MCIRDSPTALRRTCKHLQAPAGTYMQASASACKRERALAGVWAETEAPRTHLPAPAGPCKRCLLYTSPSPRD